MLFIAHEKSFYELLREYLISNNLVDRDLNLAVYNNALIVRCQDLGFKSLEGYSRFVMILPFMQRLVETRLLVPNCHPLSLYQYESQLEALSVKLIQQILGDVERYGTEEKQNGVSLITKVLTTRIELGRIEDEAEPLRILFVESVEGEEAYSMGFRLKTILPEIIRPRIVACESYSTALEKAKKAAFPPGKATKLNDNYRSLYLEKNKSGFYQVADSVREFVNFRKFDILTQKLEDDDLAYYHIISCNNVVRFYPREAADLIIEKLTHYLAPGGLMLLDLPDGYPAPALDCLDRINLGETYAFRKNEKPCPTENVTEISGAQETLTNRLIQAKAFFLDQRFDLAKKIVEEILHHNIDSLRANHFKGDVYVKLKEIGKALLQYRKVQLIDPRSVEALYNSTALSWISHEREMALESLDKLEEKLPDLDEAMLIRKFDINGESFETICGELRQKIENNEEVDLDELQKRVQELKETQLEIPNIVVPDPFQKGKDLSEESQNQGEEGTVLLSTSEIKVVNIAELPSTRDYGEHDPWKKKMKELEERRERGEIIDEEEETSQDRTRILESVPPIQEEELPPPVTRELPGVVRKKKKTSAAKLKDEDEDEEKTIEYRMPKGLGLGKSSDGSRKVTKLKNRRRPKFKRTSSVKSTKRLYVKPVSPDIFEEDEEYYPGTVEEEYYPDTEVDEEEESDFRAIGTRKLDLRNFQIPGQHPEVYDEIARMEIGLSPGLKVSLEEMLSREDLKGLAMILKFHGGQASPPQREILEIMDRIIQVSTKKKQVPQPIVKYEGKLKEVYEKILKIKRLLANKNLLEASILFHQLIKMRSTYEDLPDFQKRRLQKLRGKLEDKFERYQKFKDKYFTDPLVVFQKDMWEVLAQLSPRDNLVEVGEKYGLDPDSIPPELRL